METEQEIFRRGLYVREAGGSLAVGASPVGAYTDGGRRAGP